MAEGNLKFSWVKGKAKNKALSPPVVSFVEIMDETLAAQLQDKDLEEFDREQEALEASLREFDVDSNDCSRDHDLALQLSQDPDYSVDAQLALELQRQFDREDEFQYQIDREEATKKGTKIALGSDRFGYKQMEAELQEDDYGYLEDEEREIATDLRYRSKVQEFPPCGFKKNEDGEIITKHNKEIGQKRNCEKMLSFKSNHFNCGDVMDCKLSSRIYNDLQMFSKTDQKRNTKHKDKTQIATSDASVDVKTRLILLRWINNGDLDRVEGVIAVGKESTVLNGVCDAVEVGTSSGEGPSEERRFAVKVHKQTLNAFHNRRDYVKDDYRFKNPRSIMKIWCEKEFLNLRRLHRSGLPCPAPIQFKKHVLLMSMIQDENGAPAPKLKNYIWTSEEEKIAVFNQVKDIMVRMYNDCKLVHADLSEFNLLFAQDKIYVIDIAQAVDLSHPQSLVFLERDVSNILAFFEKNATERLPTRHALFSEITGINGLDAEKDLLTQIESYNEVNVSANNWRKHPGEYELMLLEKEKIEEQLNESDSDDE